MLDAERLNFERLTVAPPDSDQLTFDHLSAMALAEWPAELRLPVRSSGTGHQVDGLADLERGISGRWRGDPLAILMNTLHWNILRAVHLAFADADVVEIAALPSVRTRFEEDIRILATSLHVREADRLTLRSYLGGGRGTQTARQMPGRDTSPARLRSQPHLSRRAEAKGARAGR